MTPKDYYHGSGHWAEPRHDHAVARLREAFTNREMATRRGAEGKRRMEADFSPEAVGKLMDARLRSLNL